VLKQMAELKGALGGEALGGMNTAAMVEKVQGVSFFLGTPPSFMNGLFLNTATYVKTSDPKGYLAALKDMLGQLDGKKTEGASYQASYTAGTAEGAEKTPDTWSLKINMDQESPMGERFTQLKSFLFGPGSSITGYAAEAPGGVVVTYFKNKDLLKQVVDSAGGQKTLIEASGVRTISENLPAERVAEGYIGVKSILDVAAPMAGLYDFKVPDDLPPIGLAATSVGGGARLTFFVPQPVVETLAKLSKAMNGDEEPSEEKKPTTPEKTGQPKF
jgi:hypothetical protein